MEERTRRTISVKPANWWTDMQSPSGTTRVDQGQYTYLTDGTFERTLSQRLPTLVSARRKGEFLMKPYTHVTYSLANGGTTGTRADHYNDGTWSHTYVANTDGVPGCQSGLLYPSIDPLYGPSGYESKIRVPFSGSLPDSTRRALVLAEAYKKAADADLMSLVSMAEARKTYASALRVLNSTRLLAKWYERNGLSFYASARNLRPRALWRLTGNLASLWLEYRYGVQQLWWDYKSLCELAQHKRGGNYAICRAMWTDTNSLYSDTISFQSGDAERHYILDANRKDRVVAGVVIKLDPAADFIRHAGLDKPFTSAWELVPLSFVFDWVVDVSGALAAFEGRYLRQPVASWTSVRTEYMARHRNWLKSKTSSNGSWLVVGNHTEDTSSLEKLVRFERVANPAFYLALPMVRLNLNWKRLADGVSLLRQLRHDAFR